MSMHDEPVQGPRIADWEPLGQIEAHQLPAPSDKYPAPWRREDRGNGHVDIFDAQNRYFAHVHCWDPSDFEELERKLTAAGPRP